MPITRLFLDTSFAVANFDRRDQFHAKALGLRPFLEKVKVETTESVLIEIANAMSSRHRIAAAEFIDLCYQTPSMEVVGIDSPRLLRGLALYRTRVDKDWGLTDCLSFDVMREHGLLDALTADRHFVQAGFRALLLEGP